MPVVTVLAWSSTASPGRASEAWRVQGSFPPSLGDTMVSYGFSILIECPWFDQYTAPMLEISKEIELARARESESELFTQEGVWPAMPVLGFSTLACCSGVERECE